MVDSIGKSALAAIQRGLVRAANSAESIANPSLTGDSNNLVEAFLDLAQGKREVQAGRKLSDVDKELNKAVLDILA